MLDNLLDSDPRFRAGLPVSCHQYMGSAFEGAPRPGVEDFETMFRELLGAVAQSGSAHDAADAHGLSFLANRLPPSAHPKSPAPSQSSRVRLHDTGHARLIVDIDKDGEKSCFVYHCVANSREANMVGDAMNAIPTSLRLPFHHRPALATLFAAHPNLTKVARLPGLSPSEQLECVGALHTAGLLEVA
eukprot:NODE_3410_length_778_cov_41.115226_g2850_i0.p3 GENE.NODE_3410_length_778_cov_41.115226_g2850_i0~~NODE_3410_length_778_cov_41.115226_g2850_i0.p3  ORF type:complete len:188 (+),score=42.93 NODE_3410_length_778_cov_41.115226_g2850_i0:124-687(+)